MTNTFYNENAMVFFNDTVSVDMSSIYQHFLPLLVSKARILDAGCGSGRDTYSFMKLGFEVTAFDASEELVKKAREYTGIDVTLNTFENFRCNSPEYFFDAIWACASLLHVPSNKISVCFRNLSAQLKGGGIFYCSFKLGNNDTSQNGRDFTNADEARLSTFIKNTGLIIEKIWITDDARPDRHDEKWLNAILIKR